MLHLINKTPYFVEDSLHLTDSLLNQHFFNIQCALEISLPVMIPEGRDIALFLKGLLQNTVLSFDSLQKQILSHLEAKFVSHFGKQALINIHPDQISCCIKDSDFISLTEFQREKLRTQRIRWISSQLSAIAWEECFSALALWPWDGPVPGEGRLSEQFCRLTHLDNHIHPLEEEIVLRRRILGLLANIKNRLRVVFTDAIVASAYGLIEGAAQPQFETLPDYCDQRAKIYS